MNRVCIGLALSTMFIVCGVSAMKRGHNQANQVLKNIDYAAIASKLAQKVVEKIHSESNNFRVLSDRTTQEAKAVYQFAVGVGHQGAAHRISIALVSAEQSNQRYVQNVLNPRADRVVRTLNFDDVSLEPLHWDGHLRASNSGQESDSESSEDSEENDGAPAQKRRRFNPDEDATL